MADTAEIELEKPGQPPGFCTQGNRRYVLIAAILGSSLSFIDGSMVTLALPAMRSTLDADLTQALWINNGYLLPLSALILFGGALGDRFGVARIFSMGIACFVAASMGCALAGTAPAMIFWRIVQGAGAALMVPGSLAMIARAYPKEERGKAIGRWAAASALTTAMGPIITGFALDFGGPEVWRWLFAINLPLGALALWLALSRVDRDSSRPDHPLDPLGAALITAGLGCLTYGFIGRGETVGIAHPTLVATGVALICAFLLWQTRARHPMMPLSLFADRGFAGANISAALIYFAFNSILFFLPMTLISARGLGELWVAATFAPLSVMIPLLSSRAGALADRYGAGVLIGAGGASVTLGCFAIAWVTPTGGFLTHILPATTVLGIGMGLLVAPLSAAVMTSAPEEQSGLASGINNAVTRVAGLLSIASLGIVAGATYGASGGPDSFGALAEGTAHAEATLRAFTRVAIAAGLASALGAALAWVMIPKPSAA